MFQPVMLVFGGVECFKYHFNKSEIGLSSTAKFDNIWPAWHVEDHQNCFLCSAERKKDSIICIRMNSYVACALINYLTALRISF